MEEKFVTVCAPSDDCTEFRIRVEESGYYPCGVPGLRGPFATLNEAAAAIFRLYLRAQRQGAGAGSTAADAAPNTSFGSEDSDDLTQGCDKDAYEALKEPGVLSLESPQHTPPKESSTGSSSSSQSAKSDVSSPLKEPLSDSSSSSESTKSDASPPLKRYRMCGSTSTIWVRKPDGSAGEFQIRMDKFGLYHTYPIVGGPFGSLHEADDAINRYVHKQQLAKVQDPRTFGRQPGESEMDWFIRNSMYGPRGSRRKKLSKSEVIQHQTNEMHQFVQVILDKYNNDHNFFEDLALEVKDVVSNQWIFERLAWYRHFNFTAKTKRDNNVEYCTPSLFFAEVMGMQGEDDWVINCCCIINPDDDGLCYGCKNDGNVNLKHPCYKPYDDVAFIGGHWDVFMPFEPCDDSSDTEEEEDEEVEVKRLTAMFKALHDPKVLARVFS